jgi:hypothetical protein
MQNKVDLKRELGSLDMLISALADELEREPSTARRDESSSRLLAEMREALNQLRQARGIRKMWLVALEGPEAIESSDHIRARRRSNGSGISAIH